MKILFHAYNTCCQSESGGVQVRVRKIKSLLEARGHKVDFFSAFETNLRDYDVLHLFMLTPETTALITCAKNLGLKVVMSSIITIEKNPQHIYINHKLDPIYRKLGFGTTDGNNYASINRSDYVIAETMEEKRYINKYYHVNNSKIGVLPNGVEPFIESDEEIFSLIGYKCKYVLQVGRIDENKNLLRTIKAIKGANYDLVVVGGKFASYDSGYFDMCLKEAKGESNIHFVGWLKAGSRELASAYKNAHALIMPSFHETFGLTATEGAISGCHVCLSNTLPILEFQVFDKELSFNPNDINEIRRALDTAMSRPKDNVVKNRAMKVFSWEKIVDKHIEIYKA